MTEHQKLCDAAALTAAQKHGVSLLDSDGIYVLRDNQKPKLARVRWWVHQKESVANDAVIPVRFAQSIEHWDAAIEASVAFQGPVAAYENLWPTWAVEEAFKHIGTDWERQQAIDRLPEILAEGKPEWRGP